MLMQCDQCCPVACQCDPERTHKPKLCVAATGNRRVSGLDTTWSCQSRWRVVPGTLSISIAWRQRRSSDDSMCTNTAPSAGGSHGAPSAVFTHAHSTPIQILRMSHNRRLHSRPRRFQISRMLGSQLIASSQPRRCPACAASNSCAAATLTLLLRSTCVSDERSPRMSAIDVRFLM